MSRGNNGTLRCLRCRLAEGLCICSLLPRLQTRTRVVLYLHCSEDRKSTNTGRLASECLVNSRVLICGKREAPVVPFAAEPGRRCVVLFPEQGSSSLEDLRDELDPVTLVVPDGTWRQASKARRRTPGLAQLQSVAVPLGERSKYRLRTAPRADGLATIEAIARSLSVLEGATVGQELDWIFRVAVERMLWARGLLPRARVTGGIPAHISRRPTAE